MNQSADLSLSVSVSLCVVPCLARVQVAPSTAEAGAEAVAVAAWLPQPVPPQPLLTQEAVENVLVELEDTGLLELIIGDPVASGVAAGQSLGSY